MMEQYYTLTNVQSSLSRESKKWKYLPLFLLNRASNFVLKNWSTYEIAHPCPIVSYIILGAIDYDGDYAGDYADDNYDGDANYDYDQDYECWVFG